MGLGRDRGFGDRELFGYGHVVTLLQEKMESGL